MKSYVGTYFCCFYFFSNFNKTPRACSDFPCTEKMYGKWTGLLLFKSTSLICLPVNRYLLSSKKNRKSTQNRIHNIDAKNHKLGNGPHDKKTLDLKNASKSDKFI